MGSGGNDASVVEYITRGEGDEPLAACWVVFLFSSLPYTTLSRNIPTVLFNK